ncbi:hypothetical protein [Streptococcus ovuberis]|uniref:Uncharacterized protein n=1 Tax=Streptococcus ovuberis TaxID=1936207 RepID=A0A7X6MXB7_9STRE|nr:hypothetical protein [Streptococcus ovuberis]NKZ19463.1 hypothetical protein [Streptococcus ovuberis]
MISHDTKIVEIPYKRYLTRSKQYEKDWKRLETAYDASGHVIAEHKDIHDKGQTVKVKEQPTGPTTPSRGSQSGVSGKRVLPSTGTERNMLVEIMGLMIGFSWVAITLRKTRDTRR